MRGKTEKGGGISRGAGKGDRRGKEWGWEGFGGEVEKQGNDVVWLLYTD